MNPKVRDAIQMAMDRCFSMNALCDRMVYVMEGQWFLTKFAGEFHHKIAHAYPDWADKLGDILLGEGETVTQGQTIGYVGTTGYSTGNHLHLEIRVNGSRVDPEQYWPDLPFYRQYNT